ncbi:methionyl-tRNA formyltransferase [Acinetobacter sp. B10A]|uniref:methionyl-tRNA formyltransferase n=1 Tax=Acinetobacter baretiae TaxID=2605383 RepID=UPI001B3C62A7|nr:methionyl-tRNA formyltransferase [Acinetobacter baretiae]MBF7686556.1 methionyl-tRNA formyltransferase [Acinetobacter baretiae]
MNILFAGTPEFAAIALEALINTPHNIVAVYTQPDRKSGRGQKIHCSEVKQLALLHNLPIFQPENFKKSTNHGLAAQQELLALDIDVMVVAAYGLILPQEILDAPKYGCLNIHGSLLPRWRGAAPIQRAIAAQDQETGITIMKMERGLDTGDILLKTSCPITINDTSATLYEKLAKQGAIAICQVVETEKTLIHYLNHRHIQNEDEVTYAHKLTKTEAKIDWQLTATQICANIRAFNPWPIAFIAIDQYNLRVWSGHVAIYDLTHQATYGEVLQITSDGIYIYCGQNSVLCITSLQWPNAKPFTPQQVIQANKLHVGQIL